MIDNYLTDMNKYIIMNIIKNFCLMLMLMLMSMELIFLIQGIY
jgi:hypothetical protein